MVVLDVVVVLDEVVVVLEVVVVGGKVVVVVVLVVVDELVVDELVVDDLTTTVLAEIVLGVLGAELDELSLGASVELTPAPATELVDAASPLAATTDDVVVVAFGSN